MTDVESNSSKCRFSRNKGYCDVITGKMSTCAGEIPLFVSEIYIGNGKLLARCQLPDFDPEVKEGMIDKCANGVTMTRNLQEHLKKVRGEKKKGFLWFH